MISKIVKYWAVVLLIFIFFPVIADARVDYTVFPRLSIEGMYNDNYHNEEENKNEGRRKNEAFLFTISPGILLSVMTRDTLLDLDYSLNATGYFVEDEKSSYEYFNQRGLAGFRANLSRDFSIFLRDEIIKNVDTLLIDENLTRQERRTEFVRNSSGGDLIYRYTEGSEISAGYLLTIQEYFNNIVDDSKRHDFSGRITHSFNVRNIGYAAYRHSIVDYKRLANGDHGQVGREDIYDDEIRGRFMHYFTPMFSTGLSYGYLETHYDGATKDYHIHDGALEAVYNITRYLTADGRFGMFFREQYGRERDNTGADSWENGLLYRAGLTYTYPTFLGAAAYEGGYSAIYTNPQTLEFFKYWRAGGEATYHLVREILMLRGRGYYMVNSYPDSLNNRKDHIWNAGGGIDYRILNWLLFSLEYGHTMRNSNLSGFHYVENSYLARITISYRFSTMERERETRERRERETGRRGEETDAQ